MNLDCQGFGNTWKSTIVALCLLLGMPPTVAREKKYTYRQNMQRNASLLSKIHSLGRYSVTAIKGAYIENFGTPEAREVDENTFSLLMLKIKETCFQ
jgi:hypothetical protein